MPTTTNWTLPTLSSTYTNVLTELDARLKDLLFWVDPQVTNLQTNIVNSKRWNSNNSKWEKYTVVNSVAQWNDLAATYDITVKNAELATKATTLTSTDDVDSASTYYPLFSTGTGAASGTHKTSSTRLTFIPSTGTLASTTFSGALSGNATSATSAGAVTVAAGTADSAHYIGFFAGTSGNKETLVDADLKYNPSTKELVVTNITGTASSATNATNATKVQIAADITTNSDYYVPFVTGEITDTTPTPNTSIKVSNGTANKILFNPSTATLTTKIVNVGSSFKVGGTEVISSDRKLTNIANWADITVGTATSADTATTATTATTASTANALKTDNDYMVNSLGIGTAASTTAGELRTTGNIVAFYSSDQRLKENIAPISNALNKVMQLSGNTFDWTDDYISKHGGEDPYFMRKRDVGIIAQELEKVLPELVVTKEDGFKAVKYDRVVALLIEAIKELNTKIEEAK